MPLNAQTKLLIKVDSLLNSGNYKSALNNLENNKSKSFLFVKQRIKDIAKMIFNKE